MPVKYSVVLATLYRFKHWSMLVLNVRVFGMVSSKVECNPEWCIDNPPLPTEIILHLVFDQNDPEKKGYCL